MVLEMCLWRTDGRTPKRIAPTALALESTLENYFEADPAKLGRHCSLLGARYRILIHIPKEGCVGVGTVTAEAKRLHQAHIIFADQELKLEDQRLVGNYRR